MAFPHRQNDDGTVDSICPHCFATVATSRRDVDLERAETAHVCEPERLKYYEMNARKEPRSQSSVEPEPVENAG